MSEDWLKDYFADGTAECSLWTVSSTGGDEPTLLAEHTASEPVWSPDGRFIAFFGTSGKCESFCHSHISIVPSKGGEAQKLGPELVQTANDQMGWSPGLAWLPESAAAVGPTEDVPGGNELELQRCVDIWNRARMQPYPTGAVNVSLVEGLCQVTLSDNGRVCAQSSEMPFRFWCPSRGWLHFVQTDYRVWNGQGSRDGTLSLFDPPKGPRLALPKAPPYPLLDGYVIPYGKDGEPLPDLKLTAVDGTCEFAPDPDGYPLAYPDRYPHHCFWQGYEGFSCFRHERELAVGDILLCPDATWREPYDPMGFFEVKVSDTY